MRTNPLMQPDDRCEFIDLPVSPTIRVQRASEIGGIPGLRANELADVEELERMMLWQIWGPLWMSVSQAPRWDEHPRDLEEGLG